MPVGSRTELVAALAAFDAAALLGTPEGPWLDFKARPYRLGGPNGDELELAKDIAAFANVAGGLIVVGVRTKRPVHDNRDLAAELTPFDRSEADLVRIENAARDLLHPPQTVAMTWFPADPTSTLHYLVITVEPVPENERYVVTLKAEHDGQSGRQPLVGVPIRAGASTRWLQPLELHQLIRAGRSAATGAAGPAAAAQPPPVSGGALARADADLERLQETQGWADRPTLLLQSFVEPPPLLLPGLHAADGIRGYLQGTDYLRHGGFHFQNPYVPPQAVPTGLLLPSAAGLGVHVGTDATVTAGVVADRRLLARSQDNAIGLPVSAVVLTEVVVEYFRLVDEHVAVAWPGAWQHRVSVRRMKKAGVSLQPGRTGPASMRPDHDAVTDLAAGQWAATLDVGRDAATALAVFYPAFGLDASTNPWCEQGRLDVAAFVADMDGRPAGPA